MTGWHLGKMLAFDLETTGIDVESDRIVTASTVGITPDQTYRTRTASWLVDPGVDIPEAATAVHGITTDHAKEHGERPEVALDAVAADLALALVGGVPVVGMNLPYDLTLLDRECRRHRVPTLDDRLDGRVRPVIDVHVLDKQVDPYRKGSRKLTDLCEHYAVRLDDAHDSTADAVAAARVAYRICQRFPELAAMSLGELHDAQITWAAEQAASLAAHWRRKGDPRADDVDGSWPIRPITRQEALFA